MSEINKIAQNSENLFNESGITYYMLESDIQGDYTKGCGLYGNEVDSNFYFLRTYDIESVDFDCSAKTLTIKRVGNKYIPIEINMDCYDYVSDISLIDCPISDTGALKITYKNREEPEYIGGFLIKGKNVTVETYDSIGGDGSLINPLKISESHATGQYSPVNEYLDLTNGDILPSSAYAGHRVVTKEAKELLYPYETIKKIEDNLKCIDSEWRIPTKDDFDCMLNSIECEEYRNHNISDETIELGDIAGQSLKSTGTIEDGDGLWHKNVNPDGNSTDGNDIFGFNAIPFGFCHNNSFSGFGSYAAFWTSTSSTTENEHYIKEFIWNTNKVAQKTFGENSFASIRFVKDYNNISDNYNEFENILGLRYPTTLFVSPNEDFLCSKIWTSINFYGDKNEFNGKEIEELNSCASTVNAIETSYYINEYDGTKWISKKMSEGDCVVILNKNNENYCSEYKIINGNLVNFFDETISEIEITTSSALNDLNSRIESLSGSTSEIIGELSATVKTLSSSTVSELNSLNSDVLSLSASTKEFSSSTVYELNSLKDLMLMISASTEELSASTINKFENIKSELIYISGITESLSGFVLNEISNLSNIIEDDEYVISSALNDIKSSVTFFSGYVKSIENKVQSIENDINDFKSGISQTIKEVILNYLIGVNGEISIKEFNNKLNIGFDDNAVFGNN